MQTSCAMCSSRVRWTQRTARWLVTVAMVLGSGPGPAVRGQPQPLPPLDPGVGPGPGPGPRPEDCALVLPGTSNGPFQSRDRPCIPFGEVNSAFHEARSRAGAALRSARRPAGEPADHYIGILGTVLEDTSRTLASRYGLSRADVVLGLPTIDTRWTDIAAFCPPTMSSSRQCSVTRYRRLDGMCNNLHNPTWGGALQSFRRLLPSDYADNVGAPRVSRSGAPLPNARLVSAHMHPTGGPVSKTLTFLFVTWGQLLDHDVTLTAETKDPVSRADPACCPAGPLTRHPNCLPVSLPAGDALGPCMELVRSLAGLRPDCALGPRTQFNLLTSYVDAGIVYGSSFRAADSLRALREGLLREDLHDLLEHDLDQDHAKPPKGFMPAKTSTPEDGCIPDPRRPEPCFLAGDNRANEQVGLAALHTVLLREHNRLARLLVAVNPHWRDDDERVFQEARHILAATIQHISYREFLPKLLGARSVREHQLEVLDTGYSKDYNDTLDATVPDSFATAAFRFGHSLLPDVVERWTPGHRRLNGTLAVPGAIPLADTLQRPFLLRRQGFLDSLLLGMSNQAAGAMDPAVTDQVTNHLFQLPTRAFGRDLATMNLARAREHGVPGYNHFRALCGLSRVRDWEEMAAAAAAGNHTAQRFAELFQHPDDVDLWSAGISEKPRKGSLVGPTFNCLIARTFRNLKLGDRFWYELGGRPSSFTPEQLQQVRRASLARLLCDNSERIKTIQLRPMERHHEQRNPRVPCSDLRRLPRPSLLPWREDPNADAAAGRREGV